MNSGIRFKLFIMMVLEFFIWGAWLPLIFGYLPSLGFSTTQQSLILNAFPVASIVGMFFSNQWADRKFAAEKFLAFSHLVGGLAILGCGFTKDFMPFFLLMLVHCLLYVPTISITNSIAFAAMKDPAKEFGIVRMGGTIGWILAAWPFIFIFVNWDAVNAANPSGFVDWLGKALANPLTGDAAKATTKWTFIVSGIASLALAAFSFALPHTPARVATQNEAKGPSIPLLSFRGRVTRPIYWISVIAIGMIQLVLYVAMAMALYLPFVIVAYAVLLLAILVGFGFAVRRLHDTGRSGWWVLMGFVPVIGSIYILVVCGFFRGTKGTNEFGEEPDYKGIALLDALSLLKHPFVLVLWLVTLVDSFVHNCYFNWTGVFLGTPKEAGGVGIASNWITPVMSIGQVAEILTMFVLGATLKKLGWRTTMIVGILGHAARFAVYSFIPDSAVAIILIQVLHGICYAFFFATVYIFVDAYFPKDIRSSAQGLFNLQILGIGALIANSICPWLMQTVYTSSTAAGAATDFKGLFFVPLIAASAAAVALALFFHPPKETEASAGSGAAPAH